tara:strand:+ start:292 stop:549 length:258 start_codon:yes stop_codon:yes gene_type:complete
MKKHTKIYLKHFDYGEQDFIGCEICSRRAVDIHHIEARGMGGSKTKDYIENLAALCRECHISAETEPKFNEKVKQVHLKLIKSKL